MSKYLIQRSSVISILFCLSLSVAAEGFVAAGEWEFSVKQDVSGMPAGVPEIIYSECLTQDQPVPKSFLHATACDITELKTLYRTVSWKMVCDTDNGKVHNEGKITFHTLNATGISRSSLGSVLGKNSTLRYSFTARRIGDCR